MSTIDPDLDFDLDPPESSSPGTLAEAVAVSAADPRFVKVPKQVDFPSGIVLGEDEAVIQDLQARMTPLGAELLRVESVKAARDMIVNQQPALCIFVGGDVKAPPYEPMGPLMGLPPSIRRHLYLVLVANNLRTLDGMAAFMHQVNMTLARQDLPHLAAALYTGYEYHVRLYQPYFRAVENHSAI